jgi:transposase-like protein
MRIKEHHMSAFTPIQQQVIAHVFTGLSFSAAAEAAGVHRNTIANWRREIPSFAAAFEKAARDQARAFHEEALDAVPQAIEAILAILNDPATQPALRLRAAGMILKMADIKSAAQERETMIVMQPGVRVIAAEPETTCTQSQSSAASRSLRQSSKIHDHAASPVTSEILHNSAQSPSPGQPTRQLPISGTAQIEC